MLTKNDSRFIILKSISTLAENIKLAAVNIIIAKANNLYAPIQMKKLASYLRELTRSKLFLSIQYWMKNIIIIASDPRGNI